jgi:hypothetical protein
MAKRKRPEPEPDLSATTVMNDATRIAQQDAPKAAPSPSPAASTQFLSDAVLSAEAANRTTVDAGSASIKPRPSLLAGGEGRSPRRVSRGMVFLAALLCAIATVALVAASANR